jgi:hypothetical protein
MEEKTLKCPNCSAPLHVPLGETDALCDFCESRLKLLPDGREMEVVKTREEMKYKERVEVRRLVLQKQMDQEEHEAWRRTAAQVALQALPVVGTAMGRGLFRAALGRSSGCLGCGCLSSLLAALAGALGLLAILR